MPRGVRRKPKDPAARPAVERGIPVKVVDILLDHLGVDEEEITLDATLVEDLGADSLDLVELELAFEEELGLPQQSLDDDVAERWATGTVDDVLADLRRVGAKV